MQSNLTESNPTQPWLTQVAPVLTWINETTGKDLTQFVESKGTWILAEAQLLLGHNSDRGYAELAQGLLWCAVGLVGVRIVTVAGGFLSWVLWAAIWGCIAIALWKVIRLGLEYGHALIYPEPAPASQTEPVILENIQPVGAEKN